MEARNKVVALLQQVHTVASANGHDEALAGVAVEIQGCLRSLEQPPSPAPETRQQGSQAAAVMCNDSAQTNTCDNIDASAQVQPLQAGGSAQAGAVLTDAVSQAGGRAVFQQIGENITVDR